MERALCSLTGENIRVYGASRTDAGVHAQGQVVSFFIGSSLPTSRVVSGLNHYLPADIAVKAAYRVPDSFDPRREAVRRQYRYRILRSETRSPLQRNSAWCLAGRLDIAAMNECCRHLEGVHDFASFASRLENREKSTVRRVFSAGLVEEGDEVTFNIVANAFLAHQVRNTVGLLVRAGQGRVTADEFKSIMDNRIPGLAGPPAPACGLCLVKVDYETALESYSEDLQR